MQLGEITKIQTGKLDANAASKNGIYPFFTCARKPLKIDTYAYDCECVLVAGNGDLNVKYYSGKFEAYQRTYIIESTDKKRLLTKYLFYFLSKYITTLRTQTTGGVIKFIKLGNLTNAFIHIPSILDQQKVIAKLDKIENSIQAKEEQLEALNELIPARFTEMFGKHSYERKPIREIVSNNIRTTKKVFSKEDTIQYIDISAIDNLQHTITGTTPYIVAKAPSRAQQHIQDNDILVSTVRPNLKNIAINKYQDKNLIASSGFCVLRPEKCVPEYLLYNVLSNEFTTKMISLTTGANYPAVKNDDVLDYTIPVPPLPLQNQFAQFVHKTEQAKEIVKKQLQDLQELLNLKMDKYFK